MGKLEKRLKELRSGNGDERRYAAMELGRLKVVDAVPDLIEALCDRDPNVVGAAISSLGDLGDVSAVPALVRLLESASWMRLRAFHSLEVILEGCKTAAELEGFRTKLLEGARQIGDMISEASAKNISSLVAMSASMAGRMGGEKLDARLRPPVTRARTGKLKR